MKGFSRNQWEMEPPCVKREALMGSPSIERVAQDGKPQVRELRANLMESPGMDFHLPVQNSRGDQPSMMERGLSHAGLTSMRGGASPWLPDFHALGGAIIMRHPELQYPRERRVLRSAGTPRSKRSVELAHLRGFPKRAQAIEFRLSFGEHQGAARGGIQAMKQSRLLGLESHSLKPRSLG